MAHFCQEATRQEVGMGKPPAQVMVSAANQARRLPLKREDLVEILTPHVFLFWSRAITVLTLFWPAVQVVDSAIISSLPLFALSLMG